MELCIVIVSYRSEELVLDCLASIERERQRTREDMFTVVVENAPGDAFTKRITSYISGHDRSQWITLIQTAENGGFSFGNNIGIRAIAAQAYLLLNSDTIVLPGLFEELRRAIRSNPNAGIIAPRLEGLDGEPQTSCFRWPQPRTELIRSASSRPITHLFGKANTPLPISDKPTNQQQWVSFAAVLIRREVIDEVGLLDEGYFMYFEDIDYCRRARNAQWDLLYWPNARVAHIQGGTSLVPSLSQKRKRRPLYYYESRSRYYAKFYGVTGLWRANLYWILGRCISICRECVERKRKVACDAEWRDIWTNCLHPFKRRSTDATQ